METAKLKSMTGEEVQSYARETKPDTRWAPVWLKRGRVHEIVVYKDGSLTVRDVGPAPEPE
jgi:hypothetical protein